MDKKLIAKVQQLTPDNTGRPEALNQFAECVVIAPQEKEIVLKKGRLYSVFEVNANAVLDAPLVANIIKDVLRDSYYQSENVSPIQSLEKAIYEVNEKVTKLSVQSIGIENPEIEFNIISAVLWGNVLYVVQFGKGQGYLMRGTQAKKINLTTEGNYSVSSGVIQDDDVVILSTEKFAQKYPPEVLLRTAISAKDLEEKEASIILKLNVDTSFTEEELIDFKLKNEQDKKFKVGFSNIFKKLKKEKPLKVPAETPAQSVDTIAAQASVKVRKSLRPKFNIKSKTTIIAVLLMFGLAIAATIYKNKNDPKPANTDEATVDGASTTNTQTAPVVTEQPKEDQSAFYDIRLADDTANPNEIVAINDKLIVTDSGSGKIFVSDIETPKFEALPQAFAGIRNLAASDADLGFTDNTGYKEYNFESVKVTTSFDATLGISATYLGNVYTLVGTQITKYTNSNGTFADSEWTTDTALENAKDMSIAYGIYVITADKNVVSYVSGEKTDFALSGLEGGLKEPTKILTNVDFDNIYIADKGLQGVAVFNDKGEFSKLIKPKEGANWNDIKDFTVTADESKVYILNGSKVYEAEL